MAILESPKQGKSVTMSMDLSQSMESVMSDTQAKDIPVTTITCTGNTRAVQSQVCCHQEKGFPETR